MPFASLGLMPELTRALVERGYSEPTPVQTRVIPEILAGRDILAGAQTGTGKTAGFALPILQKLHGAAHAPKAPRALVLVPTRELAAQVNESVRVYGKYLRLRTQVIFGGVGINPQIDGAAPRHRHCRRDPGAAARSRSAAHSGPVASADPGARRSRSHARHGIHRGHPPGDQAAAARSGRT